LVETRRLESTGIGVLALGESWGFVQGEVDRASNTNRMGVSLSHGDAAAACYKRVYGIQLML